MKKLRLNHQRLNEILLDPSKDLDKRVHSDFQIYYIQEAAKAFMDIECNDFVNRENNQYKLKVNEKVIEILTEFNLFLDADPFYNLYQKSVSIKDLDKDSITFKNAEKLALEALSNLEIREKINEPENRTTIELKKVKERLSNICKDLNIPMEEALNFINN